MRQKILFGKRIINKVIIINIVFSICVIIFLGVNNLYIKGMLNEKNQETYQLRLSEFQKRFYTEITAIKNVSIAACENADVKHANDAVIHSNEYMEYVKRTMNFCKLISNAFGYGVDFNIELLNHNMVVTGNGCTNSEYYNPSFAEYDYAGQGKLSDEYKKITALKKGLHAYHNNIVYVYQTSKNINVYVTIGKNNFLDFVDERSEAEKGGFAIYIDGKLLLASESLSLEQLERISLDEYKNSYMKLNGKKYGITTNVGEFEDKKLTFVYFNLPNEYENMVRYVNGYTLLSVFIFLLLNVIMLVWQYRLYIPIRKLALSLYNYNRDVSEIDVINSAVEKMRKDNASMQCELRRNAQIYEGQMLVRLMDGEKADYSNEIVKTLSLKFEKYVALFILADKSFDKVKEVESYIAEQYYFERVFVDKACKTYIVCCDNRELFTEMLGDVIDKYSLYHDIIFGISSVFSDIDEVSTAYIESRQAVYGCTVSHLIYSHICIAENSSIKRTYSLSKEKEHELINATISGQENKVAEFFDEFIYGMFDNISYRSFCRLYSNLVDILYNITNAKNAGREDTFDIDDKIFAEDIHDYVKNSFIRVAQMCRKNTKSMYEMIIEYIDNNIDQYLSVNSIAYSLKITPEYLSSYFKKLHGINISTYINNVKMERAKELLKSDSNMKIAEVADKVGIDQVNTFIRKFKKYTGVTPGQYKQTL